MPFLLPNQQHQSTEGSMYVPVYKWNSSARYLPRTGAPSMISYFAIVSFSLKTFWPAAFTTKRQQSISVISVKLHANIKIVAEFWFLLQILFQIYKSESYNHCYRHYTKATHEYMSHSNTVNSPHLSRVYTQIHAYTISVQLWLICRSKQFCHDVRSLHNFLCSCSVWTRVVNTAHYFKTGKLRPSMHL